MEKKLRQYQTLSVSFTHLGRRRILFQTDDEPTIKSSKRAVAQEVMNQSEMTALESLDSDRAANGLVLAAVQETPRHIESDVNCVASPRFTHH